MDIYTMDRSYQKVAELDMLESSIWTDRYHGDGAVELSLPPTKENVSLVPTGTLVGLDESDEPMILQTKNIEGGILKVSGITIVEWLKNRFVRSSPNPTIKNWISPTTSAGQVLALIVDNWATTNSPYLTNNPGYTVVGGNNVWNDPGMGLPYPYLLAIPGLISSEVVDSGERITFDVPFGPVYDALKNIAEAYNVGMKITLRNSDPNYPLGFHSFKGVDRTSAQTVNAVVQFAPELDSLTGVKEFQSFEEYTNAPISFAPSADPAYQYGAGPIGAEITTNNPNDYYLYQRGFDGYFTMLFSEITDQQISDEKAAWDTAHAPATIFPSSIWQSHQISEINSYLAAGHKGSLLLDGQIVPTNQFQYGRDYNMGDIVEVQGNSGETLYARITEYIRSKDSTGKKAYPTFELVS